MRILVCALLIAGCAPWVESASLDSVSIGYEMPMPTNGIAPLAASSCEKTGRKLGEQVSDLPWGRDWGPKFGRRVAVFTCI